MIGIGDKSHLINVNENPQEIERKHADDQFGGVDAFVQHAHDCGHCQKRQQQRAGKSKTVAYQGSQQTARYTAQ